MLYSELRRYCRSCFNEAFFQPVSGAAQAKEYTAMKAEAEKRRKHQAKCDEAKITFTPFAMETSGGLGPSAEATWQQIVRVAADRKVGGKMELSQRWAWGLGTSLMREIGKSVTDRGHLCTGMGGALRPRVEVEEAPPVEPDYFIQPPDLPPEFGR